MINDVSKGSPKTEEMVYCIEVFVKHISDNDAAPIIDDDDFATGGRLPAVFVGIPIKLTDTGGGAAVLQSVLN